jgi:hypothetical protein
VMREVAKDVAQRLSNLAPTAQLMGVKAIGSSRLRQSQDDPGRPRSDNLPNSRVERSSKWTQPGSKQESQGCFTR